jgi:O-antigen ligase
MSHPNSSAPSVPRLGFDDYLVMGVAAALFLEQPDDSLWLKHGFPIPNLTWVVVGAVVLGRATFLASRGRFDLSRPSWREWTIIGLFAVYAVTSVAAYVLGHSHSQPKGAPLVLVSHLGQSFKTFVHFGYLALITLALGRLLTPALLRRAFMTFFVLAFAAAVIACLQALDQNVLHTGATSAFHLISRPDVGGFIRPSSIFSETAVLGYYMLIGLVVGLWLNAASPRIWIWVGMGFCVIAALLGAAAGPAVGFIACFVYLLWRARPVLLRFWRELAVIAVVGIAVIALLPVGAILSNRASGTASGTDRSAVFRKTVDRASVKIWQISPLTGVGLGNSRYYAASLVHFRGDTALERKYGGKVSTYQSVSTYLGTASESGVFGVLALATVLLALFLPLPGVRQEGAWVTETPILLFIVAFFFINLFVFPIFWFWVGARLAQLRHLEEPVESTQPRAVRPEPITA